jgi:ectoine hydroxylase-related dioxygenase (phytanoyl-CoA dioxygenase family)
MTTESLPPLSTGGVPLDLSPEAFGWLRESTDALDDVAELRRRMAEDGYLFLPGFLDREEILAARVAICDELARKDLLDPTAESRLALAREGSNAYFSPDIANESAARPILERAIYGDRMMGFYDRLLGTAATHYDYTWLRTISPGNGTFPHCDVVYMGRGSHNLFTAWVPLGDIPLYVGGLVVVEGSHRDARLRETYCQLDVDTACSNREAESQLNASGYPGFGVISYDLRDLRSRLGGRLLTAREFRMGDLLTFSVFTVHGSLDNRSREIRISSDSRYQPANEPLDERWVGEAPPGHGGASIREMIC